MITTNEYCLTTQPSKFTPVLNQNILTSSSTNRDTEFRVPKYIRQYFAGIDDYQLKAQLLASLCNTPKLDVRLDFENLYIGLKKLGWSPEPKTLLDIIRTSIEDLGEIMGITAYADWSILNKKNGCDIQRQLAYEGIETRYQINIRNKNSADMKIAEDMRDLLEKDGYLSGTVDIFVLGTGDRDFRPVIENAKNRGKRVIVLALKNSLSRLLREAASEVRYLDSYLDFSKTYRPHNLSRAKICSQVLAG